MFPIIIQIGPIIIYSLWLCTGLAFILGVFIFTSLAKMKRLQLNFIYNNSIKIFAAAIIFARLFFVVENYQIYFQELNLDAILNVFYIWDKGLSFLGGLCGIIITLAYFSYKEKEQTKKWLDILTISTIGGLVLGHIGRFFDGSSYGNTTDLPWGILFESPSIKYAVPIHPAQLYAALYSLIIGGVLFLFFLKTKFKAGIVTVIGTVSYFTMVFLEGFIRGDDTVIIMSLRLEQVFALIVIMIVTGSYLIIHYNNKRKSIKPDKI
ncbi:prolipoprotein diacylglyceryl transferase [Candidatus Peregrinibacteria bacterium]|nr:prolipoprotein diacylglyceryl transferase [Candidatus Peregrinibacteria bacterium]